MQGRNQRFDRACITKLSERLRRSRSNCRMFLEGGYQGFDRAPVPKFAQRLRYARLVPADVIV